MGEWGGNHSFVPTGKEIRLTTGKATSCQNSKTFGIICTKYGGCKEMQKSYYAPKTKLISTSTKGWKIF